MAEHKNAGSVGGQKYEEVTIKSEPVFQGRIISLQVDEVRLPNGKTAAREIVKHPGAVCVLAIVGDRMAVVEQYRKPLERSLVEIPAGKLDPGEDPLAAARRELREETGFCADHLQHVCTFYTSPGFADEIIHLYVAEHPVEGERNPDEDEFLDCMLITLDEAKQYIADGRIRDAKTIAAVYAWQTYRLTGRFL
jgi:ADP-ribose pyrophosphatase